MTGMHLTLGGLTALIGLIGSISAIYRFLIKPIFAEQRAIQVWRAKVDARLTLLESCAPEDVKCSLRQLRQDLIE